MSLTVMKKCCGLCPYSRKNTLYLHPERAEEFAGQAQNPYADFVCHKTGVIQEDHPNEDRQNDIVRGEKSLTCAGFHAMQAIANDAEENAEIQISEEEHFFDYDEMVEHHQNKYEENH